MADEITECPVLGCARVGDVPLVRSEVSPYPPVEIAPVCKPHHEQIEADNWQGWTYEGTSRGYLVIVPPTEKEN